MTPPAQAPAPVEVKIDWEGLTKRARQIPVAGDMIGGLTAAPTGSVIAFTACAVPTGDLEPPRRPCYTVNLADGCCAFPRALRSAQHLRRRGPPLGSRRRLSQ